MDEDRQHERARHYAVCSWALRHEPVSDGAEAIYDQALTNGLAAIVAHDWPGEERARSGWMHAASGLLDVIERSGARGADGAVRIRHGADLPEYEEHPAFGRVANFTTVEVSVIRDALKVTQAIRHARSTGGDRPTLTDEHVAALIDLGDHPALFAITDELVERAQAGVAGRAVAERARAQAYYEALDTDERARREAIDYVSEHAWATEDGGTVVEECPVCGTRALVAPQVDNEIGEIGIGFCFVCSYQRTAEAAEQSAYELGVERAIERTVERDD